MNCPKCKTTSPLLANFCLKCGRDLKIETEPNSTQKKLKEFQRAESIEKWDEIHRNQARKSLMCVGIGAIFTVIGWFAFNGLVLLAVVAITGFACYIVTRFTSQNYYSIPHSTDFSNTHRCIFCGHRGIYKQGEYKTKNTHNSCSKCKTHLFTN